MTTMRSLIILCVATICLLQHSLAQTHNIYGGNIQQVEVVGKQRYDMLASKGMQLPGAVMSFDESSMHKFIGSIVECKAAFDVNKFALKVKRCYAEQAIFRLTLRHIDDDGTLREILDTPLLFSMKYSDKDTEYYVTPEAPIRLTPGTYYVGIELIATIGDRPQILFPLYIKHSYIVTCESDIVEPWNYNIGLSVAGIKRD